MIEVSDIPGGYKRCPHCEQTLLMTEEFFNHDKHAPSGWTAWCKECRNKERRGIHKRPKDAVKNIMEAVQSEPISQEVNGAPEGYKHCSKCNGTFPATSAFFVCDKRKKNGIGASCRKCDRQRFMERHNRQEDVLEGYKRCTVCSEQFPATTEFFNSNPKYKNGLHSWCKKCMYKYQKDHHLKKHKDILKNNEVIQESKPDVIEPTTDPSDQCSSCGTTRGNIIGHRHKDTREIRGYLCSRCLKIVEDAQDDIDRINKILVYLKHTQLDKSP